MRFILADDKNDDEGGDCSGAGVSEMFEIYLRRSWLGVSEYIFVHAFWTL